MSDPVLNHTLDQYMLGKRLAQSTGDITLQRKIHRDLGLREVPSVYLKLENLYSRWLTFQLDKKKKNDKG